MADGRKGTGKGQKQGNGADKGGRKTQGQWRELGFQAFLALLDAADWVKRHLRGQMDMFDISQDGLRFLEMLSREGHMTIRELAAKRHCTKQSAAHLVEGMKKRGWVEYEVEILPKRTGLPAPGERRLKGWRVGHIRLSASGKKFVGEVLPRHIKVVLAFMRTLEWREQQMLVRICRKLQDLNFKRFMHEFEYSEDPDSIPHYE
jgi:hypothetical protein